MSCDILIKNEKAHKQRRSSMNINENVNEIMNKKKRKIVPGTGQNPLKASSAFVQQSNEWPLIRTISSCRI